MKRSEVSVTESAMRKNRIKKVIKRYYAIPLMIIFLSIICTYGFSVYFMKRSFVKQMKEQLRETLIISTKMLKVQKEAPGNWCNIDINDSSSRITLIGLDGKVVCDSNASVEEMDNHLKRDEVKSAISTGWGSAIRFSSTLEVEMIYGAVPIEINEFKAILRIAVPFSYLDSALMSSSLYMLLVLLPLFIILTIIVVWAGFVIEARTKRKGNKIKEDLIANISHEVRTPLTALQGYVQVLETSKDNLKDDQIDYLKKIKRNTSRLTSLFQDVLSLSVLENEKNLFYEKVFLEELTEDVISTVKQNYPDKDVSITSNVEIESIDGDAKTLAQIMTNIIDNAMKYTESGGSVNVKWIRVDNDALLVVKDTGIGIPKKHLSRVFRRFYRVDLSRSREMGGTGLGLAIVKHAVMIHGGRVWVDSEEGKGSTFTITLPVKS